MKFFFLFLVLLPLFVQAQTIHRKKNEIVYNGRVDLPGRSAMTLREDLLQEAGILVKKGKGVAPLHVAGDTIVAKGDMRLQTDFYLVRTAHYTLSLLAADGGYTYRIDSVFLNERKRDGDEKVRFAKDLFKSMEVSGPTAEATEKILNELDMNFQRMLALLRSKMQKRGPQ